MNIVYAKEQVFQFDGSEITDDQVTVELICLNRGTPNNPPVITDSLVVSGIDKNGFTVVVAPRYHQHIVR